MSRRRRKPEVPPRRNEPPIRWQDVGVRIRIDGDFWPADAEMPDGYIKPRPIPCPQCRRVYNDHGRKVVKAVGIRGTIAYFKASCCNHSFALPAR